MAVKLLREEGGLIVFENKSLRRMYSVVIVIPCCSASSAMKCRCLFCNVKGKVLLTVVYCSHTISWYVEYFELLHLPEVFPLEVRPVCSNYHEIPNSRITEDGKNFADADHFTGGMDEV
jgi:hypothetical protein